MGSSSFSNVSGWLLKGTLGGSEALTGPSGCSRAAEAFAPAMAAWAAYARG